MGLKNVGLKGKKGIVFTILTLVILSVFLLSYGIYSVAQSGKSVNKRIGSMNDFVFSTEKDLQRQIYISGFRIILLMEKQIIDSGEGIHDFNSSVNESFFSGTLYGQPQSLMEQAKFSDILNDINDRAGKMNLEVVLAPKRFYFSQDNPWNVKVNLETDVLIRDKGNLAFWNKTETISSYISIENFEDPLYVIYLHRPNNITKSTYQPFNGNIMNLSLHAQNSYYIESPNMGPSFLDRLEGKISANVNGIESIVNTQIPSDVPVRTDKSCVDYIYFSSNSNTGTPVSGMPGWFKLDDAHLSIYNVTR